MVTPRTQPSAIRARSRLGRMVAALAALAMLAAACGDSEASTTPEEAAGQSVPTVLATTSIWADVVANVACGDMADVDTIIPVGTEAHGFEPSLDDRERMDDADLIVANGLLLEEGLEDTIAAAAEAGTPVFRVAEHVDTIGFSGEPDDHADAGDDPHVWFDPQRVSAVVPELAERLIDDAGLDATAVAACVEEYQRELAAIDIEIAGVVGAIPENNRKLITNHDALGYFADRYGFEIIGTVIPAPSGLAETNPAQLEELAELIEEVGVPALFAETQHSTDDAEALAARVGDVEVVTLYTDTLGEEGSGADTYVGFLRTNAMLITTALG